MNRNLALKFIVLLGIVSLFADVTYEGRGALLASTYRPSSPAALRSGL